LAISQCVVPRSNVNSPLRVPTNNDISSSRKGLHDGDLGRRLDGIGLVRRVAQLLGSDEDRDMPTDAGLVVEHVRSHLRVHVEVGREALCDSAPIDSFGGALDVPA
jgi:hypothetical protein